VPDVSDPDGFGRDERSAAVGRALSSMRTSLSEHSAAKLPFGQARPRRRRNVEELESEPEFFQLD